MPNKDGTGPKGQGPKDGHGKGKGKGKGSGQGPMTGGKKESRKQPKSKPDLRTRIERLRTTALTQTKKAGANIIVGLHVLRTGLFGWLCGALQY